MAEDKTVLLLLVSSILLFSETSDGRISLKTTVQGTEGPYGPRDS